MTQKELETLFSEYNTLTNRIRRFFIEETDYCTREQHQNDVERRKEIISGLLKLINNTTE